MKLKLNEIIKEIDKFPIDRVSISQDKLDLANRERMSLFPWRGQFSPGLIDLLLDSYAKKTDVILDPFAGSGTLIFESARKSISCFAVEIIPSAVEMIRTSKFISIKQDDRIKIIKEAEEELNKICDKDGEICENNEQLLKSLSEINNDLVKNIITNSIIRYYGSNNNGDKSLNEAFNKHVGIVKALPHVNKKYEIFHTDARKIPLDNESIDVIITSPPYINVFNYHQNYRKPIERFGWDILDVAKSEIGSNRKNRGNRFLTVIQYSIDMLQALIEMRRIIKSNGRVIIIIGRQSKVRGIEFENYKIISALAMMGAGLKMVCRQERKFKNRFGKIIFEDILHFERDCEPIDNPLKVARIISMHFLEKALNMAQDNIKIDIESAIVNVNNVKPSPLFKNKQ